MSDSRPTRLLRRLLIAAFFVVMTAGCAAIAWMSLDYFRGVPHPFILEKLPLAHEAVFLFALKAHVAVALFSLPACLLLLSAKFRGSSLNAHRWLGRLTGAVVLAALVPSGFVLALTARGGLAGTIGFMLSGLIVAVAMVHAVGRARAGDLAAHRRAARHVVAQLSVAVTSRLMLVGFALAGERGDDAYLVALWVPVLGSALVVEAMQPRARTLDAKARGWSVAFAGTAAGLAVGAMLAVFTPKPIVAADKPKSVEALLTQEFVDPYRREMAKRSPYSREPAPSAIAVRMLDPAPRHDFTGAAFVRFELDQRYGDEDSDWSRGEYAGCIYPATREVYLAPNGSRDFYLASSFLDREYEEAPDRACVEAQQRASNAE